MVILEWCCSPDGNVAVPEFSRLGHSATAIFYLSFIAEGLIIMYGYRKLKNNSFIFSWKKKMKPLRLVSVGYISFLF